MVKDEILCSIRNMVEYLEEKEKRHFEKYNDKEQKYHIYSDAVTVREWFDEG